MPFLESPGTIGSPSVAGRKGRILIVDDELSVLRALRNTLQQQGYETHECASGKQALAALQEADFDVLLCDMLMAGMDGITLLQRAQETTPELVSVLMTGKSSVESAIAALRAGVFDYVLKPFDFSTLLSVLTRAMEVRRLRSENIQLREMVAVYELSTTIAFSLESETILRKTAETALQACQADEVSIVLPRAGGQEWYIAITAGEHCGHLIGQVVPLERTIEGWVIHHQEALVLQGEVRNARFAPAIPCADIRSALTVPLVTGGRMVGVMNINATKRRRAFTLADQKAANIVASMAAPALANTQMYHELEGRVQARTGELTRTNATLQREVLERQRAEEAVRRQEEINAREVKERQEALRLREELISVVSHEVRTPLTAIQGFAEILNTRQYPRAKQEEILNLVYSESVRLNKLIDDFLDGQRLQSGRTVYHVVAVDVGSLLHRAIAPFTQQGQEKHVIRLEVPKGLPCARADSDRIQQVVVNLLSNAIKFSPHGEEITVGACAEGTQVKVWVTDHGLGIPREEIPKLFHKFHRVESTDMRSISGTGLGLSLVKQIIEAHQGTVGVESEIGKGSTFFFTLPRVADSRPLLMRNGSGVVIPSLSELTPFQTTGTLPRP